MCEGAAQRPTRGQCKKERTELRSSASNNEASHATAREIQFVSYLLHFDAVLMPGTDPGSVSGPRSENCSEQSATAKATSTHGPGTAVASDACTDIEAEEDDDFAADIAAASDADYEESVLEDLEPIEPEEVLDLVDAQSASESADVSEESDAEPEASSSQPGRAVLNKAAPLTCDTQHAVVKQPSILYPQRPFDWRAPNLVAQMNAAAVIAAKSELGHSSGIAGVYRFPPPVFAKPPPLPTVETPPANKSCNSTPSASQENQPSAMDDDIPPPCEPEGDDCCDWAALASTLCPTSPTPSAQQQASKAALPSSHLCTLPADPTGRVETQVSNCSNVNSARLLSGPAAACSGSLHYISTPLCAPATTAAPAVSLHAPCLPAPAARTITPGVFEHAPHGVHNVAESQPSSSLPSGIVRASSGAASQLFCQTQQLPVHGSPRQAACTMLPRSRIASPLFSLFSTPKNDVQCFLTENCPSPVAMQPSPFHPCSIHDGMKGCEKPQPAPSHAGHRTGIASIRQSDDHTCTQPPVALDLVGGEADAPDPLSDILGEIDQFILHQSDMGLIPVDHAATRNLHLSSKKLPAASQSQSREARSGAAVGARSHDNVLLHNSEPFPSLNHISAEDHGQDFVPGDVDFQPLTPRTPRAGCDDGQPADQLLTDWEVVFPGISPVAADVDAAWGSDCGNSPQFMSPEMSLLSPMLQRMQIPTEYHAATRYDVDANCSPDVCKLALGDVNRQASCLESAADDPACRAIPSHATLAGCAAEEIGPLVNVCDRQGGAACHYEPCSTGSRGKLRPGRMQPGPPVKRRLNLSSACPTRDSKQHQSPLSLNEDNTQTLPPFDSAPFIHDVHTGDENMNGTSSVVHDLDLAEDQQPPAAAHDGCADALQALLDEVDAVVACGPERSTGFSSPGCSPISTAVYQSSLACSKVESQSDSGTPNTDAQQGTGTQQGTDANSGVDALEASQQHAEAPADSIQQDTDGTARERCRCLDNRVGVGDAPVHDSACADHVGEETDVGPTSTDAAGMTTDPANAEEIGDDDLYRIFAATCTGGLTEFKHPSLPTFTELLLNDDADLDWLEAEAPDMDYLDLDYQESQHPDSMHEGDLEVPPELQAEAAMSPKACESLQPDAEFAKDIEEIPVQGAKGTVSQDESLGRGQKRKHIMMADDYDDDETDVDREEETAHKMSRFERYEKRCQLREKVPERFEEGQPPRPFTRSCRDRFSPAPEDSKQADNDATNTCSDMAGADRSAAVTASEWPSMAGSSTTDVHLTPCDKREHGEPTHDPEWSDVPASEPEVKEQVVSPAQLRQLYAQVQAHAQLLVQTLALTDPASVAPTLSGEMDKLWGWRPDAPSPAQQSDLDKAANECWRMLTEWQEISAELSSRNPAQCIPASLVGALTIPSRLAATTPQSAAESLCDNLQKGWRPVLVHGYAPCVAHVPWLDHVSDLAASFGVSRPDPSSTAPLEAVSSPDRSKDHSAAENVAPDPQATTSTCTAMGLQLPQNGKSSDCAAPLTRGSKSLTNVKSTFMLPVRNDPDETRQCTNAKRLARTSPFSPHVHAAFAKFAVFFNRALFPRIVQASLVCNDKRRKQISLSEQRLMAVCVMQYGRNYDKIASLMPGWSTEHIKARLHNHKRLIKTEGKDTGVQDLRVALAEIVHRVIDMTKGPLSKEEFDLISQNMQGTSSIVIASDGVKDRFDEICRDIVTWRTPKLLNVQWLATTTAPLPVLKGIPRPVQELRQLLSPSRLNGAHPSLYVDEDLAPGSSCNMATVQYNQINAADPEPTAAAAQADASEQDCRGGSGRKKGGRKRTAAGQAAKAPIRVSAIEEWPTAYKADVLKHAQQLCEAFVSWGGPESGDDCNCIP